MAKSEQPTEVEIIEPTKSIDPELEHVIMVKGRCSGLAQVGEFCRWIQVSDLAKIKNTKSYLKTDPNWASYCEGCRVEVRNMDRHIDLYNEHGMQLLTATDFAGISLATMNTIGTLPKELQPFFETDAIVFKHPDGELQRIVVNKENRDSIQEAFKILTDNIQEKLKENKSLQKEMNSDSKYKEKQIKDLRTELDKANEKLGNRNASMLEIRDQVNDTASIIIDACHCLDSIKLDGSIEDIETLQTMSGTVAALKKITSDFEQKFINAQHTAAIEGPAQ